MAYRPGRAAILLAALAAIAVIGAMWWRAREGMPPDVTRYSVVARLSQTSGAAASPEDAARNARTRWSAAEIERGWTRVESGTSATFRSPRLDLGPDFHSIAIARPPRRAPAAAPILLWSDAPQLAGAAFARNRRELPVAQERATLILEAEALQGDQRQPVHYLFLHLPHGSAISEAVESVAIVTTGDLAAAGARASRIAADGETRDAFASMAPLSFRAAVPAGAFLAFAVRPSGMTAETTVRVTQSIGAAEYVQLETPTTAGRWRDWRAPLREARESTITLSIADGAGDRLVYWSEPLVLAQVTGDDRPNVVLVVVDALRADVLGTYGARESAMPMLDELASKSVVFQRAYAAASWTKPSIATLFTSLYPWTHALGARYYADALPRDVLTLQGVLSAYGYLTAQFSANPFTGAASGLDRGFDTAFMAPALGNESAFAVKAADIVDRFLGWSANTSPERYFAYLHFVDVHGASDINAYRAAAREVDTQLARLQNGLRAIEGSPDPLLIITADHGEAFGDHGQIGHGQSVYEEESRVPLIIQEPRQTTGRVVTEPVHQIDVMPTVLDYAGIAIDQTALQGRSLRGTGREWKPSPVIITKFTYPDDIVVSGDRAEMHAVIDFPWKLIAIERRGQPRAHELYRLDTDPAERHNLATADAARTRQLDAVLDAFLREQATARARFASTHERGVATAPSPARELVEQLRSLGYVR